MKKTRKTHKRKGSSKLASQGSRIMKKAKEIRRQHPTMKWTSCVSKAAKSL